MWSSLLLSAAAISHTDKSQAKLNAISYTSHLRFCNAYVAEENPLIDVYHAKGDSNEKLTTSPLGFKACTEFGRVKLAASDRLIFKSGDQEVGEFIVSEGWHDSSSDDVLALVMYNHDATSRAVAFGSHMFSRLKNAQIATIDAYQGPATPTIRIQDPPAKDAKALRAETLHAKTVIAIDEGDYEIVMKNEEDEEKVSFHAKNGESYLVLVAGLEGGKNSVEPQILVYPNSATNFSMLCAGLALFFMV